MWAFLDTMKPTFRGGMKGGSDLFILFRKAQQQVLEPKSLKSLSSNYYDNLVHTARQFLVHCRQQAECEYDIQCRIL